jgi:hypothetical protein
MTSLYKEWFDYLQKLLDKKLISKTLFTFNHHVLNHVPYLIEQLGCLRAFSARPLERKIGYIKRAVKSTKSAGINASNILEQEQIFSFLKMAGVMDFEEPYNTKRKNAKQTFRYHPKYDPNAANTDKFKQYPQQWCPFAQDLYFHDIHINPEKKLEKYGVTYSQLHVAMNDYLARLKGDPTAVFSQVHTNQIIQISERLWSDSMVYAGEAYKKTQKNTRNDCYCYFRSNHKNM